MLRPVDFGSKYSFGDSAFGTLCWLLRAIPSFISIDTPTPWGVMESSS
jgi:hypothetical protein